MDFTGILENFNSVAWGLECVAVLLCEALSGESSAPKNRSSRPWVIPRGKGSSVNEPQGRGTDFKAILDGIVHGLRFSHCCSECEIHALLLLILILIVGSVGVGHCEVVFGPWDCVTGR